MRLCTKHLVYALIVCLAPLNFGFISVYPSPTGAEIRKLHNLSDTSMEWSFYNGVMSLTAAFGPLLNELLFKIFKHSRKKVLFTLSAISAVSWFGIILTKLSIWYGMIFRAILGVFVGALSSISPMILVELAPPGISGFFGSLNQLSISIAYMILNLLGPSLNYINMVFFAASIPILQCCLVFFIPETCQSLHPPQEELSLATFSEKGNPVNSFNANNPSPNPNIPDENASIDDNSSVNDDFQPSLTDGSNGALVVPNLLTTSGRLCRRQNVPGIVMGLFLMFFQQFSGISAFVTNLSDMMAQTGINIHSSYIAGIVQCSQCIAVIFSSTIVDKIGRRLSWIVSCIGCVIALLLYSLDGLYNWSKYIPVVAVFLFEFFFGIGIGPIPWFIIPEYFTFKVRSKASGVCVCFNWICSFTVIFIWPVMVSSIGQVNAFFVFMSISAAALLFGFFGFRNPVPPEIPSERSSSSMSIPLTVDNI
ncbi:major facilitator superfamily transporter [Tritrichomonas foetus]|uniref:Major facilitator superfamily transporter n=1 Tax=Tritrichomonas foetus TaxID=1144522 RepID=A0A1J4J621_9EUKA|nr:major facilitator superfamily transporter [Tritrichomonas foetus]|eukprot:OHS93107.1 major facilitator superfamily transporter [Tritrichomonas foetus]